MSKFLQYTALVTLAFSSGTLLAEDESIEQPKPIPNYTIKITSPEPEETFQNSAQNITVAVEVTPALEKEDSVVVLVDGEQSGDPQQDTAITLPWLERGSHTLQAKVIQPNGPGATSDIITFYQQRTSVLLPAH